MTVIIVPSCLDCNHAQTAAEEEFRDILAMTQGKSAAEVYDRWRRSLSRLPGKRVNLIVRLVRIDGHLVYPAMKGNFREMFIKVAKGLHYHEFGVPADRRYQTTARLDPPNPGGAYRHTANVVTRRLAPSFSYSYLGDAQSSAWWFEFSAGPLVLATLHRPSFGGWLLDVAWRLTGDRWP